MNTSVSRKTKVRLRPSPWDILVAALVLALAAALDLFFLSRAAGSTEGDLVCTVSQNGRILEEITLTAGSPDQEKRYGDYVVEINHGHIRIKSAPCVGQDCVHTGWIHRSGQSVVCLPGRFVVTLSSSAPADPPFDIVVK